MPRNNKKKKHKAKLTMPPQADLKTEFKPIPELKTPIRTEQEIVKDFIRCFHSRMGLSETLLYQGEEDARKLFEKMYAAISKPESKHSSVKINIAHVLYDAGKHYLTGEANNLLRKNNESAIWCFKKAIALGNEKALCPLSVVLLKSADKKDKAEAIKWLTLAAKRNDSFALWRLGAAYTVGEGVEINNETAVSFYQRAAAAGFVTAEYNLGAAYEFGKGVPRDYAMAVACYRKAAGQNDASAYALGRAYATGQGVPQDYREAVDWHQKAAALGSTDALCALANIYVTGESGMLNYRIALDYYQKAAKKGSVVAMHNLGRMYHLGEGVTQDYIKALEWYQAAAVKGHAAAAFAIAFMYDHGQGVEKDDSEASTWLLMAAEGGYKKAAFELGQRYVVGYGIDRNYPMAIKWLQQAVASGREGAAFTLALLYLGVEGIPKDENSAAKYLRRAAIEGDIRALCHLGLLMRGIGKSKLAEDLMLSAFDLGSDENPDASEEVPAESKAIQSPLEENQEDVKLTALYNILTRIANVRLFFRRQAEEEIFIKIDHLAIELERQFELIHECISGKVSWDVLQENISKIARVLESIEQQKKDQVRKEQLAAHIKAAAKAEEKSLIEKPPASIAAPISSASEESEELEESEEEEEKEVEKEVEEAIQAVQEEVQRLQAVAAASAEDRLSTGGDSIYSLTNQRQAQIGVIARLMRRIKDFPQNHPLFYRHAQHIANLLYHDNRFSVPITLLDRDKHLSDIASLQETSENLIHHMGGRIRAITNGEVVVSGDYLKKIDTRFFQNFLELLKDDSQCEVRVAYAKRILQQGNRKGKKVLVDEKLLHACAVIEAAYAQMKHEDLENYESSGIRDLHENVKFLAQQIRHPVLAITPMFLTQELYRQKKRIRHDIARQSFTLLDDRQDMPASSSFSSSSSPKPALSMRSATTPIVSSGIPTPSLAAMPPSIAPVTVPSPTSTPTLVTSKPSSVTASSTSAARLTGGLSPAFFSARQGQEPNATVGQPKRFGKQDQKAEERNVGAPEV